jgi:hypothetical protein
MVGVTTPSLAANAYVQYVSRVEAGMLVLVVFGSLTGDGDDNASKGLLQR